MLLGGLYSRFGRGKRTTTRLRDPMARVDGEGASLEQLGTPQHRQDCWSQPRGEPDGFARP
jgi:hypothetical protein